VVGARAVAVDGRWAVVAQAAAGTVRRAGGGGAGTVLRAGGGGARVGVDGGRDDASGGRQRPGRCVG
jgi:hypothetical protein